MFECFATAPSGLSELLKEELTDLGAEEAKAQPRGVHFVADQETLYRCCLWSRLANRFYLTLVSAELKDQDSLSKLVKSINWQQHLNVEGSFAVTFSGQGLGIDHTHYGALLIKDGVVDYFKEYFGDRPSVDTEQPDIRIHGHLNRNHFTLSLDMTGYSLHQRGYREGRQVEAPLKENVAAAILMRAQWPQIAAEGGTLYDPMCGSATFLIEGAFMATDRAPALSKVNEMAFIHWKKHDPAIWEALVAEAELRHEKMKGEIPPIYGSDLSHRSLEVAESALWAAELDDVVELKQMSVAQGRRWGDWPPGLVVTNPPYGERLSDEASVKQIYLQLGTFLRNEFQGWQAAVLTCHPELGLYLGIKAIRSHSFNNGAMACKLLRFEIAEKWFRQPALKGGWQLPQQVVETFPDLIESEGATMVANRIKKNLKSLKSWVKQNEIHAYRVYDADLPEYALAIDFYQTLEQGNWLVINEYAAPKSVNPAKAKKRLYEALAALEQVFVNDYFVPRDQRVYKVRERQKGHAQYEKQAEEQQYYTIIENGAKIRVNFTDYLDTGVFLDHRDVRQYLAQLARGKSLLNLFCYTATATVEAAVQGCQSSLSLDLSKTYLYWAQHNFWANQLSEQQHRLQQEDVLKWLTTESIAPKKQFDVIFLDPPSFSTSKRMEAVLDVQRDHVRLIQQAAKLLRPQGILIFSTNLRKFKLDQASLESDFILQDLTRKTLPKDFQRHPKIHQVWQIERK
ncbi:bifunctional 23S rRNA (guanine(2069)-N(7))-methyltransferase RlmK/23S rRNA (guanine(2445)-N(2))-methyltransferase RlmL [Galenea microaerophila]